MSIDNDICPICNTNLISNQPSERDTYKINCPRCGKYEVTDSALILFQNSEVKDKVLSVSYWIRKHQSLNHIYLLIDIKNLMRLILIPFIAPKVNIQADNLILWLGNDFV